jgi:hypothetical protein
MPENSVSNIVLSQKLKKKKKHDVRIFDAILVKARSTQNIKVQYPCGPVTCMTLRVVRGDEMGLKIGRAIA